MTNTELATIGLDTPSINLPAMVRVPSGKGFKQVQRFGVGSAKDIKETLKAQNPDLKGKALSKAVNNVLTGEKTLREQLGVAFVQACIQNGKVPDRGEVTKNGARLIFVNAAPIVEAVSVETDYENMSADDISVLLKKLEGILDTKVNAMEA